MHHGSTVGDEVYETVMTIVLNATPLIMGGALQACVAFIRQAISVSDEIEWHFLVSKQVADQLAAFDIDIRQHNGLVLTPSPAKNKMIRRKTKDAVAKIDPLMVFTFFGPSYVSFDCPHLMGVADGWITHSTALAMKKKGGLLSIIRLCMLFFYKRHWYKKASHWVVEAECAKLGMIKRFGIDNSHISIVPNNCGDHYLDINGLKQESEKYRILTLSSYYQHKNLEIIPQVAFELKQLREEDNFNFILTLDAASLELQKILAAAKVLGVENTIVNVGPVAVKDGPELYSNAELTFMPSLLETFSAVYPESMVTGTPIITSDLGFAHDICESAALYFDPCDALDAAEKINRLLSDEILYQQLISEGYRIAAKLPSQRQKYQLYKNVMSGFLASDSC